MCLRPQSAGSTIPRLRPTGSSLGIAPVDYDPVVLLKPFGPRLAAGALPSRASSMVAPGRPIRVPAFAVVPHEPLHTFHPRWPVRRYPHLRISVRGPGPSGTSTHLTRQLPGTRPGPIRPPPPSRLQPDNRTPLTVRQPEHGLERQRRQDRQVGILGLPAPARAPLGLPRLDCLVGE